MFSRVSTEPCVQRRIAEIAAALRAVDRGEPPHPFAWVGRPPFYPMGATRWETAIGSGGASFFRAEEQAAYSFIYSGLRDFEEQERLEQAAWAQLRSLTEVSNIEAPQRANLTEALQTARLASFRTAVIFDQRLRAARDIGIDPVPVSAAAPSICRARTITRDVAGRPVSKFNPREPD